MSTIEKTEEKEGMYINVLLKKLDTKLLTEKQSYVHTQFVRSEIGSGIVKKCTVLLSHSYGFFKANLSKRFPALEKIIRCFEAHKKELFGSIYVVKFLL